MIIFTIQFLYIFAGTESIYNYFWKLNEGTVYKYKNKYFDYNIKVENILEQDDIVKIKLKKSFADVRIKTEQPIITKDIIMYYEIDKNNDKIYFIEDGISKKSVIMEGPVYIGKEWNVSGTNTGLLIESENKGKSFREKEEKKISIRCKINNIYEKEYANVKTKCIIIRCESEEINRFGKLLNYDYHFCNGIGYVGISTEKGDFIEKIMEINK